MLSKNFEQKIQRFEHGFQHLLSPGNPDESGEGGAGHKTGGSDGKQDDECPINPFQNRSESCMAFQFLSCLFFFHT